MDAMIQVTMQSLKSNNMAGYFVNDANDLLPLISDLIPDGAAVGCGDSVTLEQTGVFDYLRRNEFVFYDKHQPGLISADKRHIYIKNFSAHTFLTGANAITMDGKIFNIDGNGSRVAPMIYGPEQVIIVVGKNKIVKDVDAAIWRARQIAAPLDAKRLNKQTPCVKSGQCIDCKHTQRICNSFVLIARQFVKERIKVIIINETFGY